MNKIEEVDVFAKWLIEEDGILELILFCDEELEITLGRGRVERTRKGGGIQGH